MEEKKEVDEKYCSECGKIIRAKAEICPHCGVRQIIHYSQSKRIPAAIFAFFLGIFGAHRFYLGQTGMGLLYLLFFWSGIPAIVALVEGIMYLTMSEEEFNNKYVNN